MIAAAFSTEHGNSELVKASIDQMVEKHAATKMINKLVPVMEGEKYGIVDTIRDDIDHYMELLHNPPDSIVVPRPCDLTIAELIQSEIMDTGIPWHLDPLTDIISGVRRKTLGLIYAYVDSGKTSFALASAANFARHMVDSGERIAYAGNEESARRVKLRFIQALLNKTRTEIKENEDECTRQAEQLGLGQIDIFDEIVSGQQIEYILKEYKPMILYVDQAPNVDIETKRRSDGVEYLNKLFQWYRRLANRYDCAIIGVSQGVGDAENTKWLKLSDIYGSRIAIQGALDYGIGIGRIIDDPAQENLRFLHVPKNKLHDGEMGKITCYFNKTIAHWKEA
jgi:KaiC/GvpD/RAD55 family RecA-like ATPase